MAVETPSSLIRQIQAILRQEAGVPTYDPSDPTLRGLPPVDEAISGLDPSTPPYLRCRECRAALLRGVQSLVCVYCGAEQRREGPPLTVSFNTTLACRKLLQSLDLDGSEVVELNTESKDSRKGQGTQKDGLVLSDLLDIELKWPFEGERVQSSSTNNIPTQYTLNLSGVDLDNFFSRTEKDTGSNDHHVSNETSWPEKEASSEHFVSFEDLHPSDKAVDSVEIKPSEFVSSNFGSFEDLHSANKAVDSVDVKPSELGNSFALWEAEFQSASSQISSIDPTSKDSLEASSSNYASSMADKQLNVESGMNREDRNTEYSSNMSQFPPLNDNWPLDDQWHTAHSVMSNASVQPAGKGNSNFGELKLSSMPKDCAQTDLWPTSGTSISNTDENMQANDDSYDDWQDFTSSGNVQDALSSSWTQANPGMTLNEYESGISSVSFTDKVEDMDFGGFVQSDVVPGSPDFSKGPSEVDIMQPKASVSGRMNEWEKTEMTGNVWSVADKDEKLSYAKSPGNSNTDVQVLLSQMHDLSFMLEDNLCTPKKVEPSDGTL